jgi:hypothetical protein
MHRFFSAIKSLFVVAYQPPTEPTSWAGEEQANEDRGSYTVGIAVPDFQAAHRFFGVSTYRRGIQPVHVRVANRSTTPIRLQMQAIDPHYFSPLEAAAANHHSGIRQLLGYGLLAWISFLPLALLLPLRLWTGRSANRRMDDFFRQAAFDLGPIPPGAEHSGFVYTNLSLGTKSVPVQLLTTNGIERFNFTIDVGGLNIDYLHRLPKMAHVATEQSNVDRDTLHHYLVNLPKATTNQSAKRSGDPVNLVVIGDLTTILASFSARWDLTEAISLKTCWKTARAFLIGSEYRYSPVSSLYLFDRPQDIAWQRIRNSINERLHLRLWAAPIRFENQPVWVGQISRDIGVRFTWKTWNLTTHRIDSDVDEARDYVLEDLLHARHLITAGYVDGVGGCSLSDARTNLTGDVYFTDGKRAVLRLSPTLTDPTALWLV